MTSTKSGERPFQAKAIDEFTHREKNIGRIRKIVIEHEGTSRENAFHLKKIQIRKRDEIYEYVEKIISLIVKTISFRFNTTIRVDHPEQKIVLYPIPSKKEDYVESELRRLQNTLRNESAKRRRPPPYEHRLSLFDVQSRVYFL